MGSSVSTYIYIDFFNNVQPVWDTKWIIAGDEAHNTDILRVKMFAEHLKSVDG